LVIGVKHSKLLLASGRCKLLFDLSVRCSQAIEEGERDKKKEKPKAMSLGFSRGYN